MKVDKGYALLIGGHAREADAFGRLVKEYLAYSLSAAILLIKYAGLPVSILKASGRRDDLLDSRLAEHKCGRALGDKNERSV